MVYDTFTASNSYKGFYSLFDEFLRENNDEKVFLIKGGPGCGKSTFMKKIAYRFEKEGYSIERVLCSSDPDSLDGIKIIEKGITVIDATSPHAIDMKYPGVCDSIIDLSRFWNERKLMSSKNDIISISDTISNEYKSVYSILNVAGILYASNISDSNKACNKKIINDYISKHLTQCNFTSMSKKGACKKRILNAINCKGTIALNNTVTTLCDSALIIDDESLCIDSFMKKILLYLQKNGYDTIAFYNPLFPKKLDHIILPKERYGFFTTNKLFNINFSDNIKSKRIDSIKFVDKEKNEQIRSLYNYKKKTVSKLIADATEKLKNIKEMHDKLEKYYIDAMDYDKMDIFSEQFINSLFCY